MFKIDHYWQELKTKRSSRRKNSSSFENKDGNSKFPSSALGVSNPKASDNFAGSVVLEESGNANSRRKQHKGLPRQLSSHKQRFFSSNFRNHGTSRNSNGIISESPPSNSVGFFFSSTPPENYGSVWCDCCLCCSYNELFVSLSSFWLYFSNILLLLRALQVIIGFKAGYYSEYAKLMMTKFNWIICFPLG